VETGEITQTGARGLYSQLIVIDGLTYLDRGRLLEVRSPEAAARAERLIVSNGYVAQDCGAEASKCYWIEYALRTPLSTSRFYGLVVIRYAPQVLGEFKVPLVPVWRLGYDLMPTEDLVTYDPGSDDTAKELMQRFGAEHKKWEDRLRWRPRFSDFL
jgi:hypothetical protein